MLRALAGAMQLQWDAYASHMHAMQYQGKELQLICICRQTAAGPLQGGEEQACRSQLIKHCTVQYNIGTLHLICVYGKATAGTLGGGQKQARGSRLLVPSETEKSRHTAAGRADTGLAAKKFSRTSSASADRRLLVPSEAEKSRRAAAGCANTRRSTLSAWATCELTPPSRAAAHILTRMELALKRMASPQLSP